LKILSTFDPIPSILTFSPSLLGLIFNFWPTSIPKKKIRLCQHHWSNKTSRTTQTTLYQNNALYCALHSTQQHYASHMKPSNTSITQLPEILSSTHAATTLVDGQLTGADPVSFN